MTPMKLSPLISRRSPPQTAITREYRSAKCWGEAVFFTNRTQILISFLLSTGRSARKTHMNWFYWDTAWSLFFSLVWFMTITQNPDARIADAHLRDEAFGG